jgi:hypothetical protein
MNRAIWDTRQVSSQSAEAMKQIFAAVQPVLKDAGYRRSGNKFNRIIEPDGIVHVAELVRGGYIHTVPGKPDVTTPYGAFSFGLGIWLPGVWQALRVPRVWDDSMEPKTIGAGSCQLSERLGLFFPVPADYWWPVSGESGDIVAAGLAEYGLPWLAGFASWDHILRQFEEGPADAFPQMGEWVRLLAMGMRLARGDHDEAERDFAEHLACLAAKPRDAIHLAVMPYYSVVPFIESLERLAIAHHFDVDVYAYAAQARQRERTEQAS